MSYKLSKLDAEKEITDDILMEYLGSDFWMLNKPLAQKLGILPALWLSHIIQKYEYFKKNNILDKEGYFYNIQKYIEEETTLSISKQTEIIFQLKMFGILDVKRKGLPARNYYKIKIGNLIRLMTSETSLLDSKKLAYKEQRNINKEKRLRQRDIKIPKTKVLGVQASPDHPSSDKPTILKRPTKKNNSKIIRDKFKNNPVPEKEVIPLFVPNSVRDIIDHWNNCGLRQHKDPTTKIYREIVKRIKSILRNKFDVKEFKDEKVTAKKILLAIDNFKLSATDPFYEPWNKDYLKRLSLLDFFYNIRSPHIKSQFIYCLDPPRPIDDIVTVDDHPDITEEFKKQYINKVLGGVHSSDFSNREENCFKKTAKMMLLFFHKYGDRMSLTPIERKYPINLVRYVFAALDKRINEDWTKVTPGWFSQPSVYSKTLPAYLYNQAIIEEPIQE